MLEHRTRDVCFGGGHTVKGEEMVTPQGTKGQEGFALVLAILALMLLTFLGLTLATTTSQELQISGNYRWSQQALYNAEGGIEVGKALLRDVDWSTIVYPARPVNNSWTILNPPVCSSDENDDGSANCPQVPSVSPAVSMSNHRDYENSACDNRGGKVGFGVVLRVGGTAYENQTTVFGETVNGAYTIWVRRPLEFGDGTIHDDADNGVMVLTVEGTAPFRAADLASGGVSKHVISNRSRKVLEFTVSRKAGQGNRCATRAGQAGGGPEGANFGGCVPMEDNAVAEGLGLNVGSVTKTSVQ
jgi:hypothetical protein